MLLKRTINIQHCVESESDPMYPLSPSSAHLRHSILWAIVKPKKFRIMKRSKRFLRVDIWCDREQCRQTAEQVGMAEDKAEISPIFCREDLLSLHRDSKGNISGQDWLRKSRLNTCSNSSLVWKLYLFFMIDSFYAFCVFCLSSGFHMPETWLRITNVKAPPLNNAQRITMTINTLK